MKMMSVEFPEIVKPCAVGSIHTAANLYNLEKVLK